MEHAHQDTQNNPIDSTRFKLQGRSGAGNTAIAATALGQLASGEYQGLIVLWSGIRRMDLPVSYHHHVYLSKTNVYPWYWWSYLGDTVWYHSGGQLGTWIDSKECPKNIQQSFATQYTESSLKYFTDLSCLAVSSVQNFCKNREIPYKMAFIYDINVPVTKNDHGHGQIDKSSDYYDLVDWGSIETDTNVYQWCLERDLLSWDGYHPTTQGIVDYVDSVLGINMAVLD